MNIRKRKFTEKAVRTFTDREEPRKAFWNLYETVKSETACGESRVHVLTYYGIGGIGKSRLLKKLVEEMQEKHKKPVYTVFDFQKTQSSRTVLDGIKNNLAKTYAIAFPLFELGQYVYALKNGEAPDSPNVKQIKEKSNFLSMALDALSLMPGLSFGVSVFKLLDQGIAGVRTFVKQHSKLLYEMDSLEADKLLERLPFYFACDLASFTERENEPVVIFLDTYECLVNEMNQTGKVTANDKWLRDENGPIQLVPNVLWVIAGREKLKWEADDKQWSNALEQHLLGSLSQEDADAFLRKAGVADKKLREGIFKLTGGTPVYLDICVDQFEKIVENGEVPQIEMFGQNTVELVERFSRYMDNSQKDMVDMMACIGFWEDELFFAVAKKVLTNFSYHAYETVKAFSFVSSTEEGECFMHHTVREVFLEHANGKIKRDTGEALLTCFANALQDNQISSDEYVKALKYTAQAGGLLYANNEKLLEHYKENVSKGVRSLSEIGLFTEAEEILRLVFACAEKETLLYAIILYDKSYVALNSGEYDYAKSYGEQALECFKVILGEEHLYGFLTLDSLAVTLRKMGRYAEALEMQEKVLEFRKRVQGEEHPDVFSTMENLTITLTELGRYSEALEMQEKVLEFRKHVHGEEHPDVFLIMGNLAVTLKKLGRYSEALEMQEKVLEFRKRVHGDEHPETVSAMNNLAITLLSLGDTPKGVVILEEVCELQKRNWGEEHPNTIIAMGNLALALGIVGRYQEKLELEEIVMDFRQRVLGEEHPDTLLAMNNLAGSMCYLGRYRDAAKLQKSAMEIKRRILGEKHPDTIWSMEELGNTLCYLGRYLEASLLQKKVLENYRCNLGMEHPDTLSAMDSLAHVLHMMEHYQEALELERDVLELRRRMWGEEHPSTVAAMSHLAIVLSDSGEHLEALEMFERVLEFHCRIDGEEHPETAEAMFNLAYILYKNERYDEAMPLTLRSIEISKLSLPEGHPSTRKSMRLLAYIYEETGETEKAEELEREIAEWTSTE